MGELTDAERALYEELGRGEGWREALALILAEMRADLRSLPCRAGGNVCPPSVTSKRPSEEYLTRHDFEDSQVRVLTEAERRATATVQERLGLLEAAKTQVVEQRRGAIRFALEMVKYIVPTVIAVAVACGIRCEMPKAAVAPVKIVDMRR